VVIALIVGWFFVPPPEGYYPYHPQPMPAMVGVLAPNNELLKARTMFKGLVYQPEKIVKDPASDDLYTACGSGWIVRIRNGQAENITKLSGKPHGFDLDGNGHMYLADAYNGRILKVNLKTGKEFHVTSRAGSGYLHFVNDVAIAPNRWIYFTESSQRHTYDQHKNHLPALEHASDGRLLAFDVHENKTRIILTTLNYANGICLSHDGNYMLICESSSYRILKYYLSGKSRGNHEIWADNLPGYCDNITPAPDGGYWVAMFGVRDVLLDFLHPYPWIKKLLSYVPTEKIAGSYGLLLKFSADGSILKSLHDRTGENVGMATTVLQVGNELWIGNTAYPYLKLYTLE